MSVTHVAGPVVQVQGRIIQRCAVCGDKLLDTRGVQMVVRPDGTAWQFRTWPEGHLVHVNGNRTTTGRNFVDCPRLPDDFCLSLVE